MNTGTERSFRGDFRLRQSGPGAWLLESAAPGGPEIHLFGVEPESARHLQSPTATRVALVWAPGRVSATLVTSSGARLLRLRAATVHEALPRLYGSLPLERLDARAQRFWRRVFFLVRIPGGRRLLGLMARRAGGSRRSREAHHT
jgi:hypothetical protein